MSADRRVARSVARSFQALVLPAACALAAACSSGTEPVPPQAAPRLVVAPDRVNWSLCAGAVLPPSLGAATAGVQLEGGTSAVAVSIASITYPDEGQWLVAALDRAATPATLTLRADPDRLDPSPGALPRGIYRASVVITSSTPGVEPANVQATLTIGECEG